MTVLTSEYAFLTSASLVRSPERTSTPWALKAAMSEALFETVLAEVRTAMREKCERARMSWEVMGRPMTPVAPMTADSY